MSPRVLLCSDKNSFVEKQQMTSIRCLLLVRVTECRSREKRKRKRERKGIKTLCFDTKIARCRLNRWPMTSFSSYSTTSTPFFFTAPSMVLAVTLTYSFSHRLSIISSRSKMHMETRLGRTVPAAPPFNH